MSPSDSHLQPIEHFAAAAAVAVLVVLWWERDEARTDRALLLGAGLAGLPLLFLVLPDALERFVLGKEGLAEALTAGVLGGLVLRAARGRQLWVAVGAAALLLEELDYGQLLAGWATPEWLAGPESKSGNLNTHSLPGLEAAWRLVPMLACVALALRARLPAPLAAAAARLRLPSLHPSLAPAMALLVALFAASVALASGDRADEAGELAAVTLVALAWRAATPSTDASS